MSTSPTAFDFGGGVNFNPLATANTNVSPNATDPFGNGGFGNSGVASPSMPANGGMIPSGQGNPSGGIMPRMLSAGTGGTGSSGASGGSGSYIPSWSPNTNTGVGAGTSSQSAFTSPANGSGLLPYNTGAYNYNPGTNLTNAFGNLGPYLTSLIQTGGYNPAVFQTLVNQLQPQINEGIATIGAQTGGNGTRFGSGYDLALGDYLSQVNLNESNMAAQLYEQSVQNSIAGLGIAAGPQAQNKANSGNWWQSLIGDAASIATAFI